MTLHSEKVLKKSNRSAIKSESVTRLARNGLSQSARSEQVFESSNAILKIVLAGVATLLLAGVALVVSANTNVPVANSSLLHSNTMHSKTSNAQNHTTQFSLPEDYVAYYRHIYGVARATLSSSNEGSEKSGYSLNSVNVNTFLLAARISNDSQLAELQMQPTFAEFDSATFLTNTQNAQSVLTSFAGVGFPHIETNDRSNASRYKPYRQLVSISGNQHGDIVPNIACMGLSPERVAKRAEPYNAKIFELAVKYNVSASLVKAVVAKESCFNAKARSRVGAYGLMQLMPETAKWLKVSQPTNVNQNLTAGVRYLAQLRKRFGSNELALAAYNAGPGNVDRYNGIPPFAETQNYVKDVMHYYRGYVATTRFVNALNDYE